MLLFVGSSNFFGSNPPPPPAPGKAAVFKEGLRLNVMLGLNGTLVDDWGLGNSKGPVGLFRAPLSPRVKSGFLLAPAAGVPA